MSRILSKKEIESKEEYWNSVHSSCPLDRWYCGGTDGTDQYEVVFEKQCEDGLMASYWGRHTGHCFGFDGKDKHEEAIELIKSRHGLKINIIKCTYC